MIANWSVLSRKQLSEEKYLEHVYNPNAYCRKDQEWLDYINLSVQRINATFFEICANRWHSDKEWCVLAFDPHIMTHEGIYFATTNNIYSDVIRLTGNVGFAKIYSRTVRSAGKIVVRDNNKPASEPTCLQAEVLYPRNLSLDWLTKIYLSTEEHGDSLVAQLSVFNRPNIEHSVDLSIFR